jgi:superfamily II DNA or RNA helicase
MVNRWNIFKDQPIRDISELCYALRTLVNSDPSRIKELNKIYKKHRKVIIFYNYNYELDILREWCDNKNIPYAEWNGHKHEEIPEEDSWVYICQYTAAQEAWECIETDCIVFYSQTYSYKALIQSAGRIDRMTTQFNKLYYYHLISSSSIDLAIKKSLKTKKNFNESKFIGDDSFSLPSQ